MKINDLKYIPRGGGPAFGAECEHGRPIFETEDDEPLKFVGAFRRLTGAPVTDEVGVVALDLGVAGIGCDVAVVDVCSAPPVAPAASF